MEPRELFGVAVRAMGLWLLAGAVFAWVASPTTGVYGSIAQGAVGALLISRAEMIVLFVYGHAKPKDYL
jgi:hypothetical protein